MPLIKPCTAKHFKLPLTNTSYHTPTFTCLSMVMRGLTHYCSSKMFHWESSEGCYCHSLCTAIAPIWLSIFCNNALLALNWQYVHICMNVQHIYITMYQAFKLYPTGVLKPMDSFGMWWKSDEIIFLHWIIIS